MTLHRIKRNILLKFRLSAALLVAGAFSIARPRESWPRITAAFQTWLRWRRDPRPTPFWIFYGRMKACRTCFLYSPTLGTCGSPIFSPKEDRKNGCYCSCVHKASVVDADCWIREIGVDATMGWKDHLRRLSVPLHSPPVSGMVVVNDGRSSPNRNTSTPCRPCGSDAL